MKLTPAALAAATKGDLANALIAMTPGGIEAQEKAGQMDAVKSQRLPKDGTTQEGFGRPLELEKWKKLGFAFGDDHDDLFVNVTFPAGWKLVPTGHSMWSHLVDEKGRQRAAMFYKAAFYDRSAHISLTRRFSCGTDYSGDGKGDVFPVVVWDCGKVIHTLGKSASYGDREDMQKHAEAWLNEKYPDWRDETAYWD